MRLGFIHFAFLGPESFLAAEASECAGEQDAFWAYHNGLFAAQTAGNGAFSQENLVSLAAELGLNQRDFEDCLDSGRHSEFVREQTSIAQSMGVRSTPAFLINGQPIVGAQPFEAFQQVIESQLATAAGGN